VINPGKGLKQKLLSKAIIDFVLLSFSVIYKKNQIITKKTWHEIQFSLAFSKKLRNKSKKSLNNKKKKEFLK